MDSSGENEASKDPGICQPTHQGYTEQDFEGKNVLTKFTFLYLEFLKLTIFFLIGQDIELTQCLLVFICQEVDDIHIDGTNTTTGIVTNPQNSIDQVCYFHEFRIISFLHLFTARFTEFFLLP